ncbi:MAG: hypothetical protein CMO66_05275 [Verrucomicrobiales bacterium]|nr:hypothetical protein [Verrucomicrobiales bacterium]
MNYLQPIARFFKLITTSSIDHEQHYKRLKLMERDIGVPVKIAVLGLTAYFLLYWKEIWPDPQPAEEAFHEAVKQMFFAYLIINVGAVGFFIFFNHWALRVVHWFTVLMNVVDAVVISGLILITAGIDSVVYWVFLVLVVRNAISIPIPMTQVVVNLVTVGCYVISIFIWFQYVLPSRKSAETMTRENWIRVYTPHYVISSNKFHWESTNLIQGPQATNGEPAAGNGTGMIVSSTNRVGRTHQMVDLESQRELKDEEKRLASSLFSIRICFLMLWIALCYGVQVLFDRDREAQREAREYALRKEQLRSTGRLAAEIAHRMKNPLAIINNAAFTLDRHLHEQGDAVKKQVGMIRDEVARSDVILTELMGYAQLSEGRVERLDFEEELGLAISEAFPDHANFDVSANVRVEEDLPAIMMQRGHLREILVNLLVNAREACENKANVHISARTARDFSIRFSVKDEGEGIADDHLERVFEAYFSTKEKGTGLGLAIVKQNIELYGGAIDVDSKLGKGTEFVITLPTRALQQT